MVPLDIRNFEKDAQKLILQKEEKMRAMMIHCNGL